MKLGCLNTKKYALRKINDLKHLFKLKLTTGEAENNGKPTTMGHTRRTGGKERQYQDPCCPRLTLATPGATGIWLDYTGRPFLQPLNNPSNATTARQLSRANRIHGGAHPSETDVPCSVPQAPPVMASPASPEMASARRFRVKAWHQSPEMMAPGLLQRTKGWGSSSGRDRFQRGGQNNAQLRGRKMGCLE